METTEEPVQVHHCLIHIRQHHLTTFGAKTPNHALTNTRRATGYDGQLVLYAPALLCMVVIAAVLTQPY